MYSVQSTEFGVATINDSFELNIEIVVDCLKRADDDIGISEELIPIQSCITKNEML